MKLFNKFFLKREINHYFGIYKKYIEFDDSEDEVVILEVTPIDGDEENCEYTEVIDDELVEGH